MPSDLNRVARGLFSLLRHHVLLNGHRFEANTLHIRADLFRDFLEDLLSQIAHPHALVELHELHNVSSALLAS